MKRCAAFGIGSCNGKIEWDHVWIYAGRQIDEVWAIVGVCHTHHEKKEANVIVRHSIQRASMREATFDDLAKYPRKDWLRIKVSLEGVDNFVADR